MSLKSEKGKTMTSRFPFKFPDESIRRDFKLRAVSLDKSMNELLVELVIRYLSKESKEA